MDLESDRLWEELSGLADAFAEAGRAFLDASRALHVPGLLPPGSLFADANDLAVRFVRLRERALLLAGRLAVAAPPVESLRDLARLVVAVAEAEAEAEAESRTESRRETVGPALDVRAPALRDAAAGTVWRLDKAPERPVDGLETTGAIVPNVSDEAIASLLSEPRPHLFASSLFRAQPPPLSTSSAFSRPWSGPIVGWPEGVRLPIRRRSEREPTEPPGS